MNRTIKITTANGLVIELADVDQLPAVMPLLMDGMGTATVQIATAGNAQPPAPPADLAALPEARPRKHPTLVYLTERERDALMMLRDHPAGMTTSQIAEKMGMQHNVASAMMSILNLHRPTRNTRTPLVARTKGGLLVATPRGRRVRIKIAERPNRFNLSEGWGN